MIDENILSKIRKLFVLADRGTDNEADVALKKALELMQAYGIAKDDIGIHRFNIPVPSRKERWLCELHYLCAQFSGTVPLLSYKILTFAGDEIGVSVAGELFFYLKGEIERQAKNKKIKGRKLINDFRIGCVIGIHEKMKELGGWRDMQLKRKNFESKYFSNVKIQPLNKRLVNDHFLNSGIAAGSGINVSRQAGMKQAVGFLNGKKEMRIENYPSFSAQD